MHYLPRLAHLSFAALLGFGSVAFAQETTATTPVPETASAAPEGSEPTAVPAAEEMPALVAAPAKLIDAGRFGVAARWRYVSVPGWFLGLFAKKNMPLSTAKTFAIEGFWRKRDKEDPNRTWEIVASVGYQNMSPADGFWLGKGKELTADTDFVQAKGFGLITFDAAYVLRQYFTPHFGIHYGAGLGLGVVRGKIMRTSAVCDQATGQCHLEVHQDSPPVACGRPGEPACTEGDLLKSQGLKDNGPGGAHRYEEDSVPSAVPIINVLFGLDFPIPEAKGLEFRIEAGFYNAFFLGLTGGYVF